MSPKKDDLGVEYDEDVEAVMNEPKSAVLLKFLDYHGRRRAAEEEKAKKENTPPPKEKLFGVF